MELRLGRCTVRSWRVDDIDALVRHGNSRAIWRNLRDRFPFPYTRADAEAWVRLAREVEPETHFAIDVGGDAVGSIGFDLQTDVARRSAEIGYWLGEAYWGRGIATEALVAVTEYAFGHFDLCRLYAFVFEWNPASARVLQKAGYRCEGRLRQSITKDGATIDCFLYARLRGDLPRR